MFYVDDLKIFAQNDKELEAMLATVNKLIEKVTIELGFLHK